MLQRGSRVHILFSILVHDETTSGKRVLTRSVKAPQIKKKKECKLFFQSIEVLRALTQCQTKSGNCTTIIKMKSLWWLVHTLVVL